MIAKVTSSRFSTGNVPGCPRQIGQVLLFGSALYAVEQPQKAFVRVSICACTSKPITGS